MYTHVHSEPVCLHYMLYIFCVCYTHVGSHVSTTVPPRTDITLPNRTDITLIYPVLYLRHDWVRIFESVFGESLT